MSSLNLHLFPQALEALTHKDQLRSQLAKQSSLTEEEQDSKTMADLRSQFDSLQLQLTEHENNTQTLTEKLNESNVGRVSLCIIVTLCCWLLYLPCLTSIGAFGTSRQGVRADKASKSVSALNEPRSCVVSIGTGQEVQRDCPVSQHAKDAGHKE